MRAARAYALAFLFMLGFWMMVTSVGDVASVWGAFVFVLGVLLVALGLYAVRGSRRHQS